ncbi:MAG: hypothetical protein OEZ68_16095 [Gammaproteobacteria bacterium]|nr:hypothetical protein [Gammaproteobacteria bacterium]MDH5802324.1 hypothetical protein [Gammaproteobacteria bacterium]
MSKPTPIPAASPNAVSRKIQYVANCLFIVFSWMVFQRAIRGFPFSLFAPDKGTENQRSPLESVSVRFFCPLSLLKLLKMTLQGDRADQSRLNSDEI